MESVFLFHRTELMSAPVFNLLIGQCLDNFKLNVCIDRHVVGAVFSASDENAGY